MEIGDGEVLRVKRLETIEPGMRATYGAIKGQLMVVLLLGNCDAKTMKFDHVAALKDMGWQETEKESDLFKAIEKAAGGLPEGCRVDISVEKGSAWVSLNIDGGCEVMDSADKTLTEQVNEAIEKAKER